MSRSHTCAGPNETAGLAGKMRRSISTCIATACLVLSSLGGSRCGTGGTCSSAGPRAPLFADAFVAGAANAANTHRHRSTARQGRPRRSEEEWDAVREERKEQLKEALGLDQKGVDKLVRANPRLLMCCVEETVVPKVAMLQERLEIDQKTLLKILSAPFAYSASTTSMLQKIDWLQDRLNLDNKTMARIISSHPLLLGRSLGNLEKKIQFIGNSLDLADKEVGKLISKYPTLITFNANDKIPTMMSYLQKRFEIDEKRLKEMLKKNPRLLPMSIEESIEPKLAFYGALIGEKKAKRLVMESINLLVVSLEKKLKPRLAEVQKSGVKIDWDETLIQRLARRSNADWERCKLEDAWTVRRREREQNDACT